MDISEVKQRLREMMIEKQRKSEMFDSRRLKSETRKAIQADIAADIQALQIVYGNLPPD